MDRGGLHHPCCKCVHVLVCETELSYSTALLYSRNWAWWWVGPWKVRIHIGVNILCTIQLDEATTARKRTLFWPKMCPLLHHAWNCNFGFLSFTELYGYRTRYTVHSAKYCQVLYTVLGYVIHLIIPYYKKVVRLWPVLGTKIRGDSKCVQTSCNQSSI